MLHALLSAGLFPLKGPGDAERLEAANGETFHETSRGLIAFVFRPLRRLLIGKCLHIFQKPQIVLSLNSEAGQIINSLLRQLFFFPSKEGQRGCWACQSALLL